MITLTKDPIRTAILLLCLATPLAGCRLGRRAEPPPMPAGLADQMQALPEANQLTTFTVQRGNVTQKVILSGDVVLAHEKDLAFRASGRLARVYVQDGERVEAGDLIAVLDNRTLEVDLELATLSLEVAKGELAQAKEDLAYNQRQAELNLKIAKLHAANVITNTRTSAADSVSQLVSQYQVELAQIAFDRVRTEVNPALELNIRRGELTVQKIKQEILDGQILAPFAGEVRFINLPENDEAVVMPANAPVARLVETNKYKIELNLPRAQLEPLQEGMAVRISAASLAGASLPGKITALPRPFGTSQGSLTEVEVSNPADAAKLHEGTTVAVSIDLRSKQDALVIPRNALREENQLYYVVVVVGDQPTRADVAVGIISDDWVEILGGLQEGQAVAISSITGVAVK